MMPHIHEWTNGYRAMRSKVFQEISPGLDEYKGYIFQIASMHRVVKGNYKIAEIPVNFNDRKYGTSKIVPTEYIPDILKYILINSSFIKFVVTGLVGFTIDFSIAYLLIHSFYFHKPTANALSGEIAIMGNFFLNNFWSFQHKQISGGREVFAKKFLMFNIVAIGAITIQYVGMYGALHLFGDTVLPIGTLLVPSWILYKVFIIAFFLIPYSYFMYNRFIWRSKE